MGIVPFFYDISIAISFNSSWVYKQMISRQFTTKELYKTYTFESKILIFEKLLQLDIMHYIIVFEGHGHIEMVLNYIIDFHNMIL